MPDDLATIDAMIARAHGLAVETSQLAAGSAPTPVLHLEGTRGEVWAPLRLGVATKQFPGLSVMLVEQSASRTTAYIATDKAPKNIGRHRHRWHAETIRVLEGWLREPEHDGRVYLPGELCELAEAEWHAPCLVGRFVVEWTPGLPEVCRLPAAPGPTR